MSSVLIGSPVNITSREQANTSTRPQSLEWICLDFGGSVSIQPTAYTLMHGAKSDRCALREWTFEGSMDKQTWHIISRHKKDTNLGGVFGSHTWQVTCSQPFRYLRIATRNYFLQICGLEIYGEMKSDYFV